MSDYVHSIPGRLRVKSAVIKKNPGEAKRAQRLLKSIRGVQSSEVNVLTGSVLILYDPTRLSADVLLQRLASAGYFEVPASVTHGDVIHSVLTGAGRVIGSAILGSFEHPAFSILAALI
jgi:hypothetical protein